MTNLEDSSVVFTGNLDQRGVYSVRLFRSITGLRCYLENQRFSNYSLKDVFSNSDCSRNFSVEVGFVPTMGALHEGHLSLIRRARKENKIVVVSIFINPLQFGPNEDLDRYPQTLEKDKELCRAVGVDALFMPTPWQMGIDSGNQQSVTTLVNPPELLTQVLCGRSRIGHFEGVATIVMKLLNIVQPCRAYFGQKDAQQVAVIRRMVRDLNIPVEIVVCPVVRESNGLALSSRNQYLTVEEYGKAAILYQGLKLAEEAFQHGEKSALMLIEIVEKELIKCSEIAVEYVELVHPLTMETLNEVTQEGLLAVAVRLGSTRLIDNVLLTNRQPVVAIDGPAGAGKSTVARLVAETLKLHYLDTGAMYRALTWFVLRSGVDLEDSAAISELISQCNIEFRSHALANSQSTERIFVNGQDVTQAIRSLEVTSQVSNIAAQPAVRKELVRQQQAYGQLGGIVAEGRDIGTHVFPDAELKIFLTASVEERARRRQKDMQHQGLSEISLEEIERLIHERDLKDSTRAIAPLIKADDAIEVCTDGLSIEDVVDKINELFRQRSEKCPSN